MERQQAGLAHLLSAAVLFLSWLQMAAAKGSRDCYSPDGGLRDYLYACYPDRATSHCCADGDFCLDNGACLDSQGDNDFTLEGCTDKDWGEGCGNYCEPSDGGNIYLSYCGVSDWYQPGNYCCGDRTHDCCSSSDNSTFFTIPLFTTVFKAPEVAAAKASSTASSGTSTATIPTDVPASATATDTTDTSPLATQGIQAVAIAVPLGALAIGTAGLVTWLLLRKRGAKQDEDKPTAADLTHAPPGSGTAMKSVSWTAAAAAPESAVAAHYPKSEEGSGWGSPQQGSPPWPLYSHPSNTPPSAPSAPSVPSIPRAELQSPGYAGTPRERAMSPQELSAEMRSPRAVDIAFSDAARHADSPTQGWSTAGGANETYESGAWR